MNAVNATLNVNKHPFNLRKIERFKMKTILERKLCGFSAKRNKSK